STATSGRMFSLDAIDGGRSYHSGTHGPTHAGVRPRHRLRSRRGLGGVLEAGPREMGRVPDGRRGRPTGATPVRKEPALQPEAAPRRRRNGGAIEAGELPRDRPAGV